MLKFCVLCEMWLFVVMVLLVLGVGLGFCDLWLLDELCFVLVVK